MPNCFYCSGFQEKCREFAAGDDNRKCWYSERILEDLQNYERKNFGAIIMKDMLAQFLFDRGLVSEAFKFVPSD